MCGKPHFPDKKTPPFASYHPELDETELLPPPDISKFKSLIGSEVADNAGTFRYTIRNIYNVTVFNGPPVGHMEELQRVFGYLQKYTGGSIPIDIEDPIRRAACTTGQQWMNSTPMPRKISQMTCSSPKEWKPIDRLCRCRSCSEQSRRSVTGIIMLLNNTPLVWISRQRKPLKPPRMVQSSLQQNRRSYHWMRYKLRLLGVREEQTVMLGQHVCCTKHHYSFL
jgi:hypothetical protein